MDQNEKIKLLEAQIKNLEKIIELQDKLLMQQNGQIHVPFPEVRRNPYINPYDVWCTVNGDTSAVITKIGQD